MKEKRRNHDNKIDVYTLTCTWAASYGAVLQAYALAKKIDGLGYQTEIIDYQPNYYGKGTVKSLLAPVYSLKRLLLDRFYIDFLRQSGLLTSRKFNNINDLRSVGSTVGACVVGSDQVWNCTKYYNGKDDAMFLDFAGDNVKRISYAASLAMPEVPDEQVDRYRSMLKKFSAISVREESGTKVLGGVGIREVRTVIDPVYLIDKSEWSKVASKSAMDFSTERYILVICLEDRDEMYEYARKKAARLGVKLYTIKNGVHGFFVDKRADKTFGNISVYDYLNIVKNAEGVVADSFHAMSFSLIFNVDIDIIPRNDKGNSRMTDLLKDLNISERITSPNDIIVEKIDFAFVNKLAKQKTDFATSFLQDALAGVASEES